MNIKDMSVWECVKLVLGIVFVIPYWWTKDKVKELWAKTPWGAK